MNNVELYIQDSNNEYVQIDLFDNENISVVDSIQDTRDIKKLYNLFTRDFNVPASPNNNKRFKHYYNSNITNGFDARLKTKALIKVGGDDFKLGLLRLISTKLKGSEIESYKVSFQGETVSLSDKLQGDEVGDLNFDEFIFLNDEETRVAGIKRGLYGNTSQNIGTVEQDSQGYDLYPDVILAPIFKDKVVAVPFGTAFSVGNATIQNNNYDMSLVKYTGLGASNVSDVDESNFKNIPVTSFDFQPSVKVGKILQMANEQYGLGLQASFYQREELDQLYMLFNGKREDLDSGAKDAFNINNSSSKSIEDNSERVVYTTESTPTHPLGVSLTIPSGESVQKNIMDSSNSVSNSTALITIFSNTSSESISIVARKFIIRNGEKLVFMERFFTDTEQGDINDFGTGFFTSMLTEALTHNDETIEFEFEVISSGALNSDLKITFEYGYISSFGAVVAYNNYAPQTITSFAYLQIKPFAPKIKLIDMLTGVFKMFNMTAYVEDGKVIIDKLADYYKDGNQYNITQYIDTKSSSIAPNTTYRNISMKYEDADDVMTKSYRGADSDITFGGYKVNKNDFIEGSEGESKDGKDYKIELPFQRMMFERLAFGFNDSQNVIASYSETSRGLQTDMVVGNQIDEKLEAVDTKPILFYGKKVDTSTGYSAVDGNTAGSTGKDLVITTSVTTSSSNNNGLSTLTISPNSNDYSNTWWNPSGVMASNLRRNGDFINYSEKFLGLSFGNGDSDEFEYNNNTDFIDGLYQANYEEYIQSIYLTNARIEKYNVVLPQSIINNYKLNDTVIVGTNLYNINKINVNLLNGKGSIELINKLNLSVARESLIAPGNLSISNKTTTSYDLTIVNPAIDADDLPITYQFYRNGVAVGSLQSGLTYSYTGGTAGQSSVWKVIAQNTIGDTAQSSNGYVTTLYGVPTVVQYGSDMPTSVSFTISGTLQTLFLVNYKISTNSSYNNITSANSGVNTISGLTPSSTYNIRVQSDEGSYVYLDIDTSAVATPSLTAIDMNNTPSFSIDNACDISYTNVTYYHDGILSLPEVGDTVYTIDDTSSPFNGGLGYYKLASLGAGSTIRIASSGEVIAFADC